MYIWYYRIITFPPDLDLISLVNIMSFSQILLAKAIYRLTIFGEVKIARCTIRR